MAVKSVEEYAQKFPHWEKEIMILHNLIVEAGLEADIKWGAPVYTLNNKNIVGIGAFKNHSALWFFNGALHKKNTALFYNAQEGKTKSMLQIRILKDNIIPIDILREYIKEAITIQEEGIKKPKSKPINDLFIPEELLKAMLADPNFKIAFEKLTPGKQKEYANYIAEAKREVTKNSRLEKISSMIEKGEGLHDKYKNC